VVQTIKVGSDLHFRIIREWNEGDPRRRVAIVTSHPIQYNAPLFRYLAADERLNVKVFYTWSQSKIGMKYDPEFKRTIDWDIPLLEGYEYEFVDNKARKPGSHHFWGIVNPGLTKKVKAWEPDIVIVYGWSFYSHLSLLYKLHGKVLVGFRGDSHLVGRARGIKRWLKDRLMRWVYKHVDLAYYVGQNNEEYFRHAGLSATQLVFVPHAVDNARFMADPDIKDAKARQWRSELGFSDGDVVFLYAGKFMMLKNLFMLIQAFKKVQVPHARLVLAGSGILEKILHSLASDDPRITFLGFRNQTEMPILYRLADVFVLPSTSETWGLSINEAMASGCAIICSNQIGCAPDLVKNYENGFVVSAKKDEEMIEAIQKLATDPRFLSECKQASLDKIIHWSIEEAYTKMADQICGIPIAQVAVPATSSQGKTLSEVH
jgi:glycosyltransferase involved in cell wall biosynthesis